MRRTDRWLLLPIVAMTVTLGVVLDADPLTRFLWASGACVACAMFEQALATARRDRKDADAELLRRTSDHVAHKLRNEATVILFGLSPASDHYDREAAKDAVERVVQLPEVLISPDTRGMP